MSNTGLQSITNYRRLSENLATAGQPSEEQLQSIAEAGFEVVINLGLLQRDYSLPDEKGLVESLGLEYVHIPVVWESPTSADLDAFLKAMEDAQGKRVFVHCALNMRASVFTALYRILKEGWAEESTLAVTQEIWNPSDNETWRSFIQTQLARG